MRTLLAILVVTFVVGCQYDPYAHLFTTAEPNQDDVAGSYLLTQQTIIPGGLGAFSGQQCLLELRADGTFGATNYPTWTEEFSPNEVQLVACISAAGRWSCDTVGSVSDGTTSQSVWGVCFSNASTHLDSLALTGNCLPYGLIMTYGDPDSGSVMIFEWTK
ncbi:MAG: hypothetical protein O2931_03500 [Planctomycetota bacterium]|nr:hypothetical protein [Planctomycetota bacterium]MDA1177842.1 hypothetical protein [Planctomycetota bacterium]